jgi:fibronectin-binding autotransporter adhesin
VDPDFNDNGFRPWDTPLNWSPLGGPPNNIATDVAAFGAMSPADAFAQPDISANSFSVAGLTFDDSGTWKWNPTGSTGVLTVGASGLKLTGVGTSASTANLQLGTDQTWDIGSGTTFQENGGLSGGYVLTKTGAGTLILDSLASKPSSFYAGVVVSAGTLQAGSTTNNAAKAVLRSNAVNLALGASLTTGSTADLSVGSLGGSGSVTPASGLINEWARGDATLSGTVTAATGLNLRGANGTTQTLSGNATGLTGTVGVNSGATLTLTGAGDNTSGVLGANSGSGTTVALRGGTFLMDNSGGNTAAANGRLSDATPFTFLGGKVSVVGNSAGTSETVGAITLNSGAATISITNNGGTGAQLTFTDSGNLRDSTAMTVNFVGAGIGTLGGTGNNPRIAFSGTVPTNTSNGMLAGASSATAQSIGWAVANGTNWAGIGASGVVALSDSNRNSSTLSSAANWELTNFQPSVATTTLSANLGSSATISLGALKISPTASGQMLAIGANNVFAPALMLTGAINFTITGTSSSSGLQIGTSTRYVWVTDAATTLNYGAGLPSTGPLTKSGDGTLNLNSAFTQIPAANVNVVAGTLRGTTTSLGGTASNGAVNSTVNLRGGVLEISGGGSITRVLGPGAAGGGGIRWHSSTTDLGDGGFSAIGGNASVTLVSAAGGATAAAPVWNDASFVQNGYVLIMGSGKADSRIDFTNNIGLDNGASTNAYAAREVRVVDNASSSTDVARLSGILSGSAYADLMKTGAGRLELTAANTYAGNTLIQQGTLLANSPSGSATGTGTVIVSGGTLGGTGTILGPVTLLSGSIAPGTSAGTLTIANNVVLNPASMLAFELSGSDQGSTVGGGVNDLIDGVINLTLDGTLSVSAIDSFTTAIAGNKWRLLNYSGTLTNNTLDLGSMPALGANLAFAIDTSTSGQVNLNIVTAVPEAPAFLFGSLICGLLGLTYYGRRLRSKWVLVTGSNTPVPSFSDTPE